MLVNRISYIVYFKNKEVVTKIEELDVKVFYVSQKSKYCTIYLDKNKEKEVRQALEKMKGVSKYEPSLLQAQDVKFEV